MHEIAITTALMNVVSKEVQRCGGGRVTEITMSVGGLQSVEPHSIKSCFDFLSEGTIMDGAVLNIDRLPVTVYCNVCRKEYFSDKNFRCQNCGGSDVSIAASGGMTVSNIVVCK